MTTRQAGVKDRVWPSDGLEEVHACPLCGSSSRTLLHEGLSDQVFFVAPGRWTLWRCGQCRSAYLDPRPSEETIGLAYGEYYTHRQDERPSPRTAFERVRAALANGYRNGRYGTRLAPAWRAGYLLASLLPPLGWPVDAAYRYLPKRRPADKQHVLDIGCGNGGWLNLIRETGWQISGVEPDPVAAAQARESGFEVRTSVEEWLDTHQSFDFVTMSHVIEHVHDPISLLGAAYNLLRPGGGICVVTPNIDAMGHAIYGRHWRGLEPPRHLVLFNGASLRAALDRSGFCKICFPRRFYPFKEMSDQSRRIQAGHDPYSTASESALSRLPGLFQSIQAMTRGRTEFLTAVAIKPVS